MFGTTFHSVALRNYGGTNLLTGHVLARPREHLSRGAYVQTPSALVRCQGRPCGYSRLVRGSVVVQASRLTSILSKTRPFRRKGKSSSPFRHLDRLGAFR